MSEKLLIDVKESLERQMDSLERHLKNLELHIDTGFSEIKNRFDTQAARLER